MGRYQAGSYYEYVKEVIETSLNNFLEDTEFPYDADASSDKGKGGPGGGMGGDLTSNFINWVNECLASQS